MTDKFTDAFQELSGGFRVLGLKSGRPVVPGRRTPVRLGIPVSQGQRLVREGEVIDSAKTNLAELKSMQDTFLAQLLPLLRQPKIA